MDAEVTHRSAIEAIWEEHLRVASALWPLASDVDRVVTVIARSMAAGGALLACGNGGSAADAQHIAAELTGRFLRDRKPLRALALHGNTSSLTAIGNDYGFEMIFSRQVEALGTTGDVLVAISTSGASKNILAAIAAAKKKKMRVVVLTGEKGKALRRKVDVAIVVPSKETARIQEMHEVTFHAWCEYIDSHFSA